MLRAYGGLPMQMLDDFEALGAKSRACSQEMMDAEALLGDIPDEFLDPIQVALTLKLCTFLFLLGFATIFVFEPAHLLFQIRHSPSLRQIGGDIIFCAVHIDDGSRYTALIENYRRPFCYSETSSE